MKKILVSFAETLVAVILSKIIAFYYFPVINEYMNCIEKFSLSFERGDRSLKETTSTIKVRKDEFQKELQSKDEADMAQVRTWIEFLDALAHRSASLLQEQ